MLQSEEVAVSPLDINIDLNKDGEQYGYVSVPYSRDDSAWGAVQIPVISFKNGAGPVMLVVGGNHGDEYEGPVAQFRIMQELSIKEISGQVIFVPSLNMPAVKGGTRTSPIDGGNMNRAFPGHPKGNITEKIAFFVTTCLVPRADVVLDMHSGGKTLDFIPSAVMHNTGDGELMQKTLAALQAFDAPVSMILDEDTTGMLDGEVEGLEKVFISTELGGLGILTPERVKIAERGIKNMLVHFEILEGETSSEGTRFMETPPPHSYVVSESYGICEPLVALEDVVKKGQPLFQVWDYEEPAKSPEIYKARQSGVLYARHAPGLVKRGDSMALVAVDFTPAI